VRSLKSSALLLTDFDEGACSSMVRVAIRNLLFDCNLFYS
jgi:hypothetical protein